MKKYFVAFSLIGLFIFSATCASAQTIPYFNELMARNAQFNKLYVEKKRAGQVPSAIEPLRQRGEQAFRSGRILELFEIFGEGTAILENRAWDERAKFLASLAIESNFLVLESSAELQISLVRIFPANLDKAFSTPPTVTIELRPADKATAFKPMTIGSSLQIAETATMANRRLSVPDGLYYVVATIESEGKKVGEIKQPVYAIGAFANRIQIAQNLIKAIKDSADPKVKAVAEQVITPEFWVQRVSALNKSVGEEPPDPIQELRRIELTLQALMKGENPFLTERGELERAYLASDGQLVPYRIYVPKSYDGKSARPLVVMLHGFMGDEKTYFSNLYDEATIEGEAEKRGWIFAAPNGRGRYAGYGRPIALEDTVKVTEAIKRDYKIDATRTYLTGHSMGGGGVWQIASAKPELFAAIAPVAGGGVPEAVRIRLLESVRSLPILIVHGAKDGIVPPQGSREMFSSAQKAGLTVKYLEVPDADHILIVGATIAEVLNFFEKNVKPANKP
jgi:pimeloyl-ACP methyl ester carboxylesterase